MQVGVVTIDRVAEARVSSTHAENIEHEPTSARSNLQGTYLMTDLPPYPNIPPSVPGPPPKRRNYWLVSLVFIVGLGLGIGGTVLVDLSTSPQEPPTASSFDSPGTTDEEAEVTPEEDIAYSPVSSDFKVALTVKEQECFGTAGCNLTLRVEPSYVGSNVPTGSWEVTYEVTGIEDEPQIQTFTLDGSEVSYQPEISVQTTSRSAEPKAEVTDVYEGY